MGAVLLYALAAVLGAVPTGIPVSAVVAAFTVRGAPDPVVVVLVAAAGVTTGRVLLTLGVRHGVGALGRPLTGENLAYVERRLQGRRRVHLAAAAVAALPLSPTAMLFAAAGALRLRLGLLAAGFAVGRIATYGVVAAGATRAEAALGAPAPWLLLPGLVGTAVAIAAVLRLDWRALLEERRLRLCRTAAPVRDEGPPPAGQ